MSEEAREWVLLWQSVDGRNAQSKFSSRNHAIHQAKSLLQQKASLKGLTGPNESISGQALTRLAQIAPSG